MERGNGKPKTERREEKKGRNEERKGWKKRRKGNGEKRRKENGGNNREPHASGTTLPENKRRETQWRKKDDGEPRKVGHTHKKEVNGAVEGNVEASDHRVSVGGNK